MQERSTSRLSEWLDNLARESWQLELIISGFAIFLLIGIYEPLDKMGTELMRGGLSERMQVIVGLPLGSLTAAWFILLVNLCIHVLFRGLWISTIGLRSVSDDIDFEALRFTPRFDRFLQRKVGSFDRYVERLEKICSVLFAFTFLILFMLLALGGVAYHDDFLVEELLCAPQGGGGDVVEGPDHGGLGGDPGGGLGKGGTGDRQREGEEGRDAQGRYIHGPVVWG